MIFWCKRWLLKSILTFVGIFLAFVIAIFIRMNYEPIILDNHRETIEELLTFGDYRLSFNSLKVYFDGSMRFEGSGVTFDSKSGKSKNLTVEKIKFALSNRNLIRGRAVIKHIDLRGLEMEIIIDKNGFQIAGIPLEGGDSLQATGIIDFFNRENQPSLYNHMKTFHIEDTTIRLRDKIRGQNWWLENGEITFSKYFLHGEKLEVKGGLRREEHEKIVQVALTLDHPSKADTADATLVIGKTHTSILNGYLPMDSISKVINTSFEGEIKASIGADNKIENPKFNIYLNDGTLTLDTAYDLPLRFNEAQLKGSYWHYPSSTLYIDELTLEDSRGQDITIQGEVNNIINNPELNLKGTLTPKSFTGAVSYLPSKHIPTVVNWLQTRIIDANIGKMNLHYYGKPLELPNCKDKCGFDGSFNYSGLSLQYMDGAIPVTGLNGSFKIKGDKILITSKDAIIAKHKFKDISVDIINMFNPKKYKSRIEITTLATGKVTEALTEIGKLTGTTNLLPQVKGTHSSKVHLGFDLKPKLQKNDYVYNVQSNLQNIKHNITPLNNIEFTAKYAKLKVTNELLTFTADGKLDGIDVSAALVEDMKYSGHKRQIKVAGNIPAKRINELSLKHGVSLEGSMNSTVSLTQTGEKSYNYEVESDLTYADIKVAALGWHKEVGAKLNIQSQGSFDGQYNTQMDFISLIGDNVEIMGSVAFNPNNPEKSNFYFKPFNLGSNKLNISYSDNLLKLRGKTLNLSNFDITKPDTILAQKDIELSIDLDNIVTSGGFFSDIKGNIKRENNKWEQADIKAKINAKYPVDLKYFSDITQGVLDIYTNHGGALFNILGIYKDLRRGKMVVQAIFPYDNESGSGFIEVTNANMVRAPVLAKLLSLLSLEQLFSSKEGIIFDKIYVPFDYRDKMFLVHDAYMNGPSIGMRFRGVAKTEAKTVNFKGELIPIAGINKVISSIPIIGSLLTGSQDGITVANFIIKGSFDDPMVSVNPLSVVTPGIIKDFFSAILGEADLTKDIDLDEEINPKPTFDDE